MDLTSIAASIITETLGWNVSRSLRDTPINDAIAKAYKKALRKNLSSDLTSVQKRIIENGFANYFAESYTQTIINIVERHAGSDALNHLEITRIGNSVKVVPIFQKNTTNYGYRYVMTVAAERLFAAGATEITSAQLAKATYDICQKCTWDVNFDSIKSRASTFISDRLGDAEKYITKRVNRQLIAKRAI